MNFLTLLDRVLAKRASLGLLLLRIAVGVVFIAHGGQKLFVYGVGGVADNFGQMGLPLPMVSAVLATSAEFFGGLFILLGLLTRWASIPVAFTMLVAFATVHGKHGFFLSNNGFEYVFVLFLATLALLFAGAGCWSLDALILRKAGVGPGGRE